MWGKQETIGQVKLLFQRTSGEKANGTVFFDQLHHLPRMSEDDSRAYSVLLEKHFPCAPVAWWARQSPEAIQAFLRDWCRNQALKLVKVTEYERSDGYFEWRIDYAIPEGRWD